MVIICGLVFALSVTPLQGQQTEEVTTTGVGAIVGGDQAKARDDALQEARRNAVEKAVGIMVSSETLVKNFQTLEDKIYTQTQGYIQTDSIVSERKSEDGATYEVTIKAIVKTGRIKDDLAALGLLMRRKGKPRIMIVVSESNQQSSPRTGETAASPVPGRAAETEMISKFKEKGFTVVDQTQVEKIRESQKLRSALEGNAEAAAALGRQFGAEVIIVGEAMSELGTTEGLGGMVSSRGRAEARAINCDTGEILAVGEKVKPGLDLSQVIAGKKALTSAGGELAGVLIDQILERWSTEVTSGTTVALQVVGLKRYDDLTSFIDCLKTYLRGVQEVNQREFESGVALLDVETTGDAKQLAGELSKKDLKHFTVEVTGKTQNKITVKVTKK